MNDQTEPSERPGIRRDVRAAIIGGLTATFVVAAAFAPKLLAGSPEVRVHNSSAEAALLESTTTTANGLLPEDEPTSTTITSGSSTSVGHVARPPKAPTTTTSSTIVTTESTQPATTSTTALVAPVAPTGVTVRPATSYASWKYSDAVTVSWNSPAMINARWKIRYGDTTLETAETNDSLTCCQRMLTGLTPDTDYTFTVSAFNAAGESPPVTVTAHTRADTAPRLRSIVKTGPGTFHITAPKLHSVFMSLLVPGIDDVEHPPIPTCSGYAHNDGPVDCIFTNVAPGHWQVHSIRIVDTTGRSTTYFGDGRLQEYGLAAMEATTVAGPYQKTTLDFGPLAFDIS